MSRDESGAASDASPAGAETTAGADTTAGGDTPSGDGGTRRERLAAHASAVGRIARWEVSRTTGTVDRRTAALGLVALVLFGAVVAVAGLAGGPALDRGIYRVGVAPDHPYHDAVTAGPSLVAVPVESRGADLRVTNEFVVVGDSAKSQAALSALRGAVERHNARLMAREENATAAFPVVVSLSYVTRERFVAEQPGGSDSDAGGSGGGAGGDGGSGGDGSGDPGTATDGSGGGGADDATGGFGDVDLDAVAGGGSGGGDDGGLPVPGLGGSNPLSAGQTGSPASIAPPFPFASLVLAFAFLVPMNFVIQAYGSTILNERVNRRGELLLVAPVTPGDIVAGKTLPYLLAMVLVTVVIALAVGGGPVSVAAVVPVALLFLAATFVGAMLARSFKELTFVTVAVSVFLTSYTFVPAIFTNVTPIALISPLTLVVQDLQGTGVSAGDYLFSTGPFYVGAAVLFLLGAGVYREEDMFTQRPVPLKFIDALDSRIRSRWSVVPITAFAIPFVFIAELLAIALLFVLPVRLSVPVLLVAIAGIEEVAKGLPVYAGFAKSRFPRVPTAAVTLGALSGLGFFLGEKVTAVVQLVGLPDLQLGRAAFASTGVVSGAGAVTVLGLLLAPLVLHAVTAGISALGATRGRLWFGVGLAVATLVHAAYNLTVVSALG